MATKTFKIGLSNTDKQNMAQDVYERLLALTFPEYDTSETYSVGDFVVYNDQLYKCIGSTSGAWDSTKWQLATLNDLVTDIEDAVQFVNDKANVDGNYPTLTAGLADNLTPYSEDSGAEQENPFISNGTGTNNNQEIVTVGDYCLFKEKQGHTLVVNQLVNTGTTNISTISGHKYWCYINGVYSVVASTGTDIIVNDDSVDKVVDITQMFNGDSDIIDDITANPSHFSWYYNGSLAYNEGSLVNANGVKLVSTGRNLFDGTHDFFVAPNRPYYCLGTATITYKDKDGNTISSESVTNTTFTTPSNCVIVGASGSGQITISPYYTQEEGGEGYDKYYPYEEPYVVETGNEVLRQAGSVKDYKEPNGTIHRLVGVVDLGTLSWGGSDGSFFTTGISSLAKPFSNASSKATNIACSIYGVESWYNVYSNPSKKGVAISNSGNISIYDTTYTTSADFKTAMSGVYLYYELATPTTEQGTPFAENLPINDYGMLYWLDSSNNLVGIPQGAKIFYPVNYKGFVDDLYSKVDGNSDDYALNSELNAKFETYLKSLTGYDGTATQVLKNVEGTLTWVTEE